MVKILVKLAVEEPGENWRNVKFRWSKYNEAVPGWVLPMNWALKNVEGPNPEVPEQGPRRHGWPTVTYTSNGPGCRPSKEARRRLRTKVFAGMKRNWLIHLICQ